MNNELISIKTPGKLMFAGEWNILEPGHTCISLAINRFAIVTATPAETWSLGSSLLPGRLITFTWNVTTGFIITSSLDEREKKLLHMSTSTIALSLSYLAEEDYAPSPTALFIDSHDLYDASTQKFGFGSSAAITVALVKALLTMAQHKDMSALTIFKLAYHAHYQAQGHCGSGFDIATASQGASIVYQRPDPTWFKNELTRQDATLHELITQPWPGLTISPFNLPNNSFLNIGYSGASAQTSPLISAIQHYKKNQPDNYRTIMHDLEQIVQALIVQCAANTINSAQHLIRANRYLLQKLACNAGIQLETPSLKKLIAIAESFGAAAKFSGAGGGDCGIALGASQSTYQAINNAWQQADIVPIFAQPLMLCAINIDI